MLLVVGDDLCLVLSKMLVLRRYGPSVGTVDNIFRNTKLDVRHNSFTHFFKPPYNQRASCKVADESTAMYSSIDSQDEIKRQVILFNGREEMSCTRTIHDPGELGTRKFRIRAVAVGEIEDRRRSLSLSVGWQNLMIKGQTERDCCGSSPIDAPIRKVWILVSMGLPTVMVMYFPCAQKPGIFWGRRGPTGAA